MNLKIKVVRDDFYLEREISFKKKIPAELKINCQLLFFFNYRFKVHNSKNLHL